MGVSSDWSSGDLKQDDCELSKGSVIFPWGVACSPTLGSGHDGLNICSSKWSKLGWLLQMTESASHETFLALVSFTPSFSGELEANLGCLSLEISLHNFGPSWSHWCGKFLSNAPSSRSEVSIISLLLSSPLSLTTSILSSTPSLRGISQVECVILHVSSPMFTSLTDFSSTW